MRNFFSDAEYQDHPLRLLKQFISREEAYEKAREYEKMRFVGYVLDIGFDEVTIITSDPFKLAVGGIPRGSFLIMAPDSLDGLPPHFTLLRVTATAPTPLSQEVQQTYFELHKKSMPELDLWTRSELQWGALATRVLGMYYPDPTQDNKIAFAGDVNNIVSGHRYKIYAPDQRLLDLIVNGTVRPERQFKLGQLRLTESQLLLPNQAPLDVPVQVSTLDFRGFRTAMFGKTRLGKSNVVKLIARSLIETTAEDCSVGQLIFDINGEYANDNPQDDSLSLRSAFPDRCEVYALTAREATPSEPLRLNFYEQPGTCMSVLAGLLNQETNQSQYIRSFASVTVPAPAELENVAQNEKVRSARKIQIFWAILKKAGYEADEDSLKALQLRGGRVTADFNPGFSQALRDAAYEQAKKKTPPTPRTLDELVAELEVINKFRRAQPESDLLTTSSGKALFDPDDLALLEFFSPSYGNGPVVIRPYRQYHSPQAGNFIEEILAELDAGKTVILDLGNATDQIRQYFSDMLSKAVFNHQERKFTENRLGTHFVQLYFEEAHNLFPHDSKDVTDVYSRFAKEGAKFHIGMVYSTQSPSTVNRDLLAQTENFFVAHMSSQEEANALARLQVAFDGLQRDILSTRTPGYMRMLTFSHRFVVPVQANKFEVVTEKQEA